MTVRTRFAPSPTGYMHIGGMRTALFNWLWARHNGGKFVLRIDDTDLKRNIAEALGPILQAFRWLELHWDEGPEIGGPHGPYFQSQRGELYREALNKLLDAGAAYLDYETPEEIQQQREQAEREGRQYISSRRSLELSEAEKRQFEADGIQPVVRLLVPREQTVAIDDAVRGHVEWHCSRMPDPVIVRGDGSPLYNFASVVDDAAMQITHVIRAEEHLTNTAVQTLLFQALGYELPVFAHIPYVAAPASKEKLSKRKLDKYRKNPQFQKMFEAVERVCDKLKPEYRSEFEALDPVMVEYYEKMGYLPEAVFNALSRLGWSYDDKMEILSREFVVEHFSLDRVVKSPAGLDPDKLASFQAHWMNQLSVEEKLAGCLPFLQKARFFNRGGGETGRGRDQERGITGDKQQQTTDNGQWTTDSRLSTLITILGDRIKLFSDILEYDEYFVSDEELEYDEKAFNKRLRKEGAADLLRKFRDRLAEVDPFEPESLERLMHEFVEAEGIKMGDVIHALRVAVTGKATGPGMFDCLALLGRAACLNRIDRALNMI